MRTECDSDRFFFASKSSCLDELHTHTHTHAHTHIHHAYMYIYIYIYIYRERERERKRGSDLYVQNMIYSDRNRSVFASKNTCLDAPHSHTHTHSRICIYVYTFWERERERERERELYLQNVIVIRWFLPRGTPV